MCEFVEIFRGVTETEFGIGVAKGHAIFGHHQHLFNCHQADNIMSQSVQKVHTLRADHVVRKDEISLGKALRHRESSPSIVHLHTPISFSVGFIRQILVQIRSTDAILMGY